MNIYWEKNPEQQKDIKILSTTTKQDLINFENYILDKNKSNPYVCGVLSFEEKTISEELKTKIITEFEDILFAGIQPENRPPVLWVEHNDKGRVELNYLTFNSLQDKRSYTVYLDKRDRGLVNDYSEIINYENNLSSPFEEKENKNTLVNTPKTNIPKDKKEFVEKLNTEILALIINEELDNREEAIKHIENMPGVKINRIRKNQISVKCDFFDDKPIVLKGDIYEEGRNYSDYRKEYDSKPKRDPQLVEAKLTELKRSFSGRIEKKEKSEIEKDLKSHRAKINQRIQKTLKENINIEYGSINNNIGFTGNNNSFTNNNDSLFTLEKINNESINPEHKTKTTTEETARSERKRDIEQINQQQQFINRRVEEIRRTQQQIGKSLDSTEERIGRNRRSLHSIVSTVRRYIRTFSAYSRKNQNKRYFEEKDELKKKNNLLKGEEKKIYILRI